jgi:hypothetical protein
VDFPAKNADFLRKGGVQSLPRYEKESLTHFAG